MMRASEPPEALQKQMDLYEKEAQDDFRLLQEKIHEVTLEESDPAYALSEFLKKQNSEQEIYHIVVTIMKRLVVYAKKYSSR